MYTEKQILRITELRHKRWSLLGDGNSISESQLRTQLNNVNNELYLLTGKRQYL
jgi:hypothetical protein